MVETALILPFLIVVCLGIIDFGWYLYNYSALENAARRASEQVINEPPRPEDVGDATNDCLKEMRRHAKKSLFFINLPDDQITLAYVTPSDGRKLGSQIEVRVQYHGTFLTPILTMIGVRDFDLDFRSRRSILDTMVFQPEPARCR
jgi:hypothetical protein